MAPKGNKRASAGVCASPKKRGRVDPMLSGIIATLQGAEDLSEQCREMLIAMAAPSLTTVKSERVHMQQLGVTMIEEMLQDQQKKLIEAAAVAKKELSELEGSKNTLVQNLEAAKSTLEEKRAAFIAAHTTREDGKAAVKSAEDALAEAIAAQKQGDANHAKLEKEKAAIESAYQEHFKTPMDANEGPHHGPLKPFIATLGLEESLTRALPSSCVKTKEQRGSFDELVLGELGKALEAKIDALGKSVAEEVSGVVERKAAITSAEAVLEAKRGAEKTASDHLEAAAAAQQEADAVVKTASEEWTTFEPRVQEATDNFNLQDTIRLDFEEGAFKDFATMRDKEPPAPAAVEEEAATAGA
jgi:chromosome segregation ATPase